MSDIINVCHNDDFSLDVETEQGKLFVHCEVLNHKKSVIKTIRVCWAQLKDLLFLAGFDKIYCYTQNKKFARLIDKDFEFVTEVSHDGNVFEVLSWELK